MIETGRHLDDDQCALLALGLATPSDHARAIAHARSCLVCEMRLRAHVAADVRAHADIAAAAEPLQVLRPQAIARIVATIATTAAAAALIAIFVVRAPAPKLHDAPEWLTTPGELVRMRSENAIDESLRAGLEAYARRDLPAAITALRAANVSGGAEQARRLYLGHALLASGNAKEARGWLERLRLDALPEPWRAEARSSLAAAWRRTGRSRQADSLESAPTR